MIRAARNDCDQIRERIVPRAHVNKRSYINIALSLNERIRKDNHTTIGPVDQDPNLENFYYLIIYIVKFIGKDRKKEENQRDYIYI